MLRKLIFHICDLLREAKAPQSFVHNFRVEAIKRLAPTQRGHVATSQRQSGGVHVRNGREMAEQHSAMDRSSLKTDDGVDNMHWSKDGNPITKS